MTDYKRAENLPPVPPTEEAIAAAVARENAAGQVNDTPDTESTQVGNVGAEEEKTETPAAEVAQSDTTEEREGFIPRPRFDQLNEKLKERETELERFNAYKEIVAEIERLGGPEALQQQIAQADYQRSESARLSREQEIEKQVASFVEDGKLDPEIAETFKRLQLETEAFRPLAENYQQEQYNRELNNAVGKLKEKFADMDEKHVRLVLETGGNGVQAAKETHDRAQSIISNYNATKAKTATTIVPEGAGGGTGPTAPKSIPDPIKNPTEFGEYLAKQKDEAFERKYGKQ